MAKLVEVWHDLAVPGCGSLGVTGLRRVWRGLLDLVLGLAGLGGLRQGLVGLMRSNRACQALDWICCNDEDALNMQPKLFYCFHFFHFFEYDAGHEPNAFLKMHKTIPKKINT